MPLRTILAREAFWATAVGALTGAIYLSTLAPGVIGIVDTPKFQFIGRVLGVAHNPGYPLYSVLSHFFGYLPIGSLAYRVNLMSALFGALACSLIYLVARRLDSDRLIAASAAVGFACGSAMWSASTVAEVYTLHVFLIAGILLALLRWRVTQRARDFYLAVVLFAIGEGHHTDIVLLLPAIAVYACTVAPRFALRARTILISAAICVAGLLQYAFVIVRTKQGAFVESPANTLPELFDVVRGKQFASALLPLDVRLLATDRLPLLARVFRDEVSAVVLALAFAGAIVLAKRSWRDAVLLLVGLVAFCCFGLIYGVADITEFMLPAYVVCWLCAAVAATAALEGTTMSRLRHARLLIVAASILLSASVYARNREQHDLSHRWPEVRFLDGLFAQIPDRSAILSEDFMVDRMIYYKTMGEQVTRGRDVFAPLSYNYDDVRRLRERGYQVFAFMKSSALLRLEGADFEYTPYEVRDGPIDALLHDLPRGSMVAVAIPAAHYELFSQRNSGRFRSIGAKLPDSLVQNSALIGIIGNKTALQDMRELKAAVAHVDRGARLRGGGPAAPIEVSADATQMTASIKAGPREILQTADGVAVAAWDPQGALLTSFVLEDGDERVPTQPGALAVFRLRGFNTWRRIGSDALDVTNAFRSGNIILRLPPPASAFVLYVAANRPLAPALFSSTLRQFPNTTVTPYERTETAADGLKRDLARDGVPPAPALAGAHYVYRVRIATPSGIDAPVGLQLGVGGIPDAAWARMTEGSAGGLTDVDLSSHLERIDSHTSRLHMARDQQAQLVGAGWSGVQVDEFGTFRRMETADAELLVPAIPRRAIRLSLQLSPGASAPSLSADLQLIVNGRAMGKRLLRSGWARYEWEIPSEAVQTVNSVLLRAPAPGSELVDLLVIRP